MAANLERQRAELIGKERLEQDLEVARAIQSRFLPQRPPAVPGLAVAGISVPSREVGGDLFHYAELPGGRLAIALGDVSGKSVPAALIMSNVMSALRAETQHEREIEKSLERVNHLLTDQIDPGRFVTLFYGIVDPGAGVMRYTSAGHNPVLRVTARGEASWLREGGLPLGVDAESRYGSAQVPVDSGDVLVAYSDGVTEAEGQEQDGPPRMFGEERLADAVRALRGGSVDQIVAGILAAVTDFAAGRPQADDITLVVVRRA
jgi:sigma-B regulation protein RsbU (phosphoserine phosphatase)